MPQLMLNRVARKFDTVSLRPVACNGTERSGSRQLVAAVIQKMKVTTLVLGVFFYRMSGQRGNSRGTQVKVLF